MMWKKPFGFEDKAARPEEDKLEPDAIEPDEEIEDEAARLNARLTDEEREEMMALAARIRGEARAGDSVLIQMRAGRGQTLRSGRQVRGGEQVWVTANEAESIVKAGYARYVEEK